MSHPTIWRCRACRAPIGVVHGDGTLEVPAQAAALTITSRGEARVPCPACGIARVWCPSRRVVGSPGR
jgi:hypothetical protein